MAFYNTTTNCFTNIIITQTYLIWPFTILQLTALQTYKHTFSAGFTIVFRCALVGQQLFTMDFCLCGAILNLKAFCFGAISGIMIELIAYWSVLHSRQSWQWLSGIENKLLGASGYWQKKLKMDSCLRGTILNLTAFCSTWTLIE